jgi:uncharacterized protein
MLWTALLLGFAGSLHCAGMCGPLALALPYTGSGPIGFSAGRVAYNAGRIATYSLLGLAAGLGGQAVSSLGFQRWLSLGAGLLILAGVALSFRAALGSPITRSVMRIRNLMGALLRHRSASALFAFGMVNGLLPCGLVYAAMAGAAAIGGVAGGVGYMLLFGLGTAPVMLALSLSGHLLPDGWRSHWHKVAPACLVLVGLLLTLRGLALGVPYLSPAADGGCCHPSH